MDEPFPSAMMQDIEHFFREVDPSLLAGYDLYHEVFDTDLFFPLQRKSELRETIQRARTVSGPKDTGPYTVMEIGADKGGGLYHWCKCFPTVKQVIACEIRGTPYAAHFEKAFPDKSFLWLPRSSQSPTSVAEVHVFLKHSPVAYSLSKIDVLFIDGDKEGMLNDFDTYLPFMDPQGVVFLHDINDGASSGPRIAFETIRSRRGYKTDEIVNTTDYLAVPLRRDPTPYENWLLHWQGRSCGVGVVWMSGGPNG